MTKEEIIINPVNLSEELTEDQLNDWFDNVDWKDLGKIFIRPNGYGQLDFIDYCDNIWDAFTLNEKKEMYEKYHTLV